MAGAQHDVASLLFLPRLRLRLALDNAVQQDAEVVHHLEYPHRSSFVDCKDISAPMPQGCRVAADGAAENRDLDSRLSAIAENLRLLAVSSAGFDVESRSVA